MSEKKVKVGMFVHNPPFQGGIVQYSVLLVNAMKDMVNFDLVGFKKLYPPMLYKGKLPTSNRSGIQFPKYSDNFVTWYNPFTWVGAYFKLAKNDVIHLHWVSPLLTPLQYTILVMNKWFSKKKVVLTCHNIEPHESTIFDKWFTKAIFSKVDHFVVHAKQNKVRLERDYGITDVTCVPHGTFGYFTRWKNKSKEELRKWFGFKEEDRIVLFFGYIREYKGLRYLLKAMKKVVATVPNAKLVVAGELWQDLQVYSEELGDVKEHVRLYPKYILDKDVYKYFDLSDIVVLPYFNTEQTISGPLLVALAFEKPLIISDVGGVSEFLVDGESALIVKGGDVKQLEDSMIKLLNDTKLQNKLSEGAKEVDKVFRWKNVAESTLEIYRKLK
jgi:glycosyltransferase involved in cell wall biosynthesis